MVCADVDPVDGVLAGALLVDEQPVEQLDVHAVQRAGCCQPVVGVHVEPVDRQVCARDRSHGHMLAALWR